MLLRCFASVGFLLCFEICFGFQHRNITFFKLFNARLLDVLVWPDWKKDIRTLITSLVQMQICILLCMMIERENFLMVFISVQVFQVEGF